MDGVNVFPRYAAGQMPPERPLPLPVQSFRRRFHDARAPKWHPSRRSDLWRWATFLPAALTTGALIWTFAGWLGQGGLNTLEYVLIALVGMTFFWISLAVSTSTVGLLRLLRHRPDAMIVPGKAMDVALLVPIYNEVPWNVFGNAAAMLEELGAQGGAHRFTLFVLSDTRSPLTALQEERAFEALRRDAPAGTEVFYRRRHKNTDGKTGNLADWIAHWGGGYEAMLVLDADSLMSGQALTALADALSSDASAGLIQSCPRLIGAETLFGRVQQFSSTVYGSVLAEGLATWTDSEGNYWGHNAIIRTAAFASCAGLPRLPSLRGRRVLILSHDFVEAGLLRRAGWAVRFLPHIDGSYEEVPATLVDYALRDRRWCHGNLQHLMILASSGFHTVSRFHLFHGAMGYLLSPAWFVLLVIWAVLGNGEEASIIRYFSEANPLRPDWPEMSPIKSLLILAFMYGMLLAPKLLGAFALPLTGISPRKLGGGRQFVTSFVIEVVASIIFAPILMMQQLVAVLRALAGLSTKWEPQQRQGGEYGWRTLLRFHMLETFIGVLLVAGMASGLVSPWLLPIGLSLALAVPISGLSAVNLSRWEWSRDQLGTPEWFDEPGIMTAAKRARRRIKDQLVASGDLPMAAE